jgi:hypothetical protein
MVVVRERAAEIKKRKNSLHSSAVEQWIENPYVGGSIPPSDNEQSSLTYKI